MAKKKVLTISMPAKPKKALTGNISEHLILTFQYYRLEKKLLQEFDEEMAIIISNADN